MKIYRFVVMGIDFEEEESSPKFVSAAKVSAFLILMFKSRSLPRPTRRMGLFRFLDELFLSGEHEARDQYQNQEG